MKNASIDIGNTNTKIGIFRDDELLNEIVLSGFHPDEVSAYLKAQKELQNVIVSAVIPLPENFLPGLGDKYRLLSLDSGTALPVRLLYDTPLTLGRDRIAAAAGARGLFPEENVLSIDAGTCIKYDFVSSKGEYIGGAISPGLEMRLKALSSFTGKLPLVELRDTDKLTGSSTEESILSGVLNGAVFEIRGAMTEYVSRYPGIRFILTGGDHKFFEGKLKNSIFVVPNLVLLGLNEILKYNVPHFQK